MINFDSCVSKRFSVECKATFKACTNMPFQMHCLELSANNLKAILIIAYRQHWENKNTRIFKKLNRIVIREKQTVIGVI